MKFVLIFEETLRVLHIPQPPLCRQPLPDYLLRRRAKSDLSMNKVISTLGDDDDETLIKRMVAGGGVL